MKNLVKKILLKYERVENEKRQKAIVLFITLGVLFIVLVLVSIFKFFFLDLSINAKFFQLGLLGVLGFITALNYQRLIKHATFVFLIWIFVYYLYLLEEQELVLLILIPILFMVISLIKTSKLHLILYSIMSFGFIIDMTITNISNYTNDTTSIYFMLSGFVSILYIISFCILIFYYVKRQENEIKVADGIVEHSTVDFILDIKKRRNIQNEDKRTKNVDSCILLLSVNEIDVMNDLIGYDACEILLKELLTIIRTTVRIDDYILRWAHDEFLVILDQTSLSNSAIVAEKIRKAIEFTGFTDQKERITVTICATSKRENQILFDAIKRAQNGLLKAKGQRKNYVFID